MDTKQQFIFADQGQQSEDCETDRCLQRQVESHLRSDPSFMASAIHCECQQGIVVLRGHVGSFHEKQMAQEQARNVEGVRVIVNRLAVGPSQLTRSVSELIPFGQSLCHSIN